MMAETVRVILIIAGFFVLGFNLAVVVHATRIVSAVVAWRLFILGKSLFTVFVIIALYDNLHSHAFGWRIPLGAVAVTLTLISLVMLDHSYRRRNGYLRQEASNERTT